MMSFEDIPHLNICSAKLSKYHRKEPAIQFFALYPCDFTKNDSIGDCEICETL